jgi:hypothetical protein
MALSNISLLETYLKDIIFTEEEITSQVSTREHIFEIKDAEKSLGFISLYDLKAYVFEHEVEAQSFSVKNIDGDGWKNIYEHPFFQRRKPQLVSTENLKDDDDLEFFIIQKGQKSGPYERYELMEKVESKEILLSDMVSFNGGLNWIKLYKLDAFERRSLRDNEQLPGMPTDEFLNKPSQHVTDMIEATAGITSLAFLGNQKKGKTLEREHEVSYNDEVQKGVSSISIYKWLLAASVIGIIYFLANIKSHLNSPFKDSVNSVGEQAEMLTPVEEPTSYTNGKVNNFNGVNDQSRSGKFETRRMAPVRPVARKSFMESSAFTESSAPQASEDSNYYYDNAAPMELDPVRSQISKENFDAGGAEGIPSPDSDPLFTEETTN